MPPIVIRLLDSINGTRQGLVFSFTLFSIYLDELFLELRDMGVGCHIGGVLLGAAGYADDISLLEPTMPSISMSMEKCEQYALGHNLVFCTDPDPRESRTKCLFMSSGVRNVQHH